MTNKEAINNLQTLINFCVIKGGIFESAEQVIIIQKSLNQLNELIGDKETKSAENDS